MNRSTSPAMRCGMLTLLALLSLGLGLHAQASFDQTLPPGFKNTQAASTTSLPFNTLSDQTWQWQYDANLFVHNGPMMINRIYVRLANENATPAFFNFTDLTITLGEASTPASAPSTTFADNFARAEIVRTGSYLNIFDATGNGNVAGWIPIDLQRSFRYDPSTGNGLIIEVRSCGVSANFGNAIEYQFDPSSSRQGHQTDCTATVSNFSNSSGAPLVKVDYTPILTQTLPAGFDAADGNGASSFPFNNAQESIWQWHYDSGEFAASGPINIRELSLRASTAATTIAAFDFPSFEVTLIEASTDYQDGNHDPVFANNILRSKVVRADGQFSAPSSTPPSGGPAATWISLQLEDSFDYDPSTGNDFIVQVRVCGVATQLFGASIDLASGAPGAIGGNRYGNNGDCMALVDNFSNNEAVPILQLGYVSKTVSSFPYRENFDLFGATHSDERMPPGWESAEWETMSRNTSAGTASFDHSTMRQNVGFYASLDDSLHASSTGDLLSSPWLDISGLANPVASFWVYSFSTIPAHQLDENRLIVRLEALNGSTYGVVPILTTHGHQSFVRYTIDLASYAVLGPFRVNFGATSDSSNSFHHDFAIDSFLVGSAPASEGGQAARSVGRLDINNCYNNAGFHVYDDASGPFYASAQAGGALNISIEGAGPNQPVAFWIGPMNIAVATFGALGQIDTGTPDVTGDGIPENILLFGSGLNPVLSFNDLFYFTDATNELHMSWQLYPFMPLGTVGTFQAASANGGGSVFLTNAVQLTINP